MIKQKIDIVKALKNKGYNTNKIRQDKIFGEATMTKFRRHGQLNINDLDKLCNLLDCQPGDLLEYVPDSEKTEE